MKAILSALDRVSGYVMCAAWAVMAVAYPANWFVVTVAVVCFLGLFAAMVLAELAVIRTVNACRDAAEAFIEARARAEKERRELAAMKQGGNAE